MTNWQKTGVSLALAVAVLGAGGAAQDGVAPPCAITVAPEQSIQEAINAAPEGAVVCLAEGEWAENLVIHRAITLRGAGQDKTVIRGLDEEMIVIDVDPNGVLGASVRIEALAVTGSRSPCPGAPERDYIDVAGEGECRTGIRARREAQVRIQDCRIAGHRRGVTAWEYAQVEIVDSVIEENGLVGLAALDDAEVTAVRVTIARNWTVGVEISGWSWAEFTECTITDHAFLGVAITDWASATFDSSTIRDNGVAGLLLDGRGEVTVRDCLIQSNGLMGVGVSRSIVLSVIGGEISGQAVGLLLSDKAEVTLTGCRVVRNRIYGISLDEVEACAFGFGGPKFTGSVTGTGNIIPGPDDLDGNGVSGLCPEYPGAPWPTGFLVEGD